VPAGLAGFSEPPIICFGTITNKVGRHSRAVQGGTMTWTISPLGGSPFMLKTDLTALPGGYSYRLEIPVQRLSGTADSPAGAIAASAKKSAFEVVIEINGEEAEIVRGEDEFEFAEIQRGKLARVDLRISQAFDDSDGDGLPDWWEDQYASLGFDKFNPNDAIGDVNGDGISNLDEYLNGTDPGLTLLTYAEWASARELTGTDAAEGRDFDLDGVLNIVEFAVDSDPRVADRTLVEQRASAAAVEIGGKTYLQMRCQKPDVPRMGITYVVESSRTLEKWKRLEKSEEDGNDLIVRDSERLEAAAARPRFIRLRIVSENTPGLVADAGVWGSSEEVVPRMRRNREGQALLASPFERALLAQGEVSDFFGNGVSDLTSVWTTGQWTRTPHLVTFTSGLLRGRAFLITIQSGQTLTLDTQGLDLTTVLAANERFDIRPAPTLASTFGNPPRTLRVGEGDDADIVELGNGLGLDDYAHDGTGWLQIGEPDERGETVIYPEEGFMIRNRGPRTARIRFFGLLPRQAHAASLPGGDTIVGSGSPFRRTLASTGIAAVPGWSSADRLQLWTGNAFKTYFHDGTHWRTETSNASRDRIKIKGGTAVRIQRSLESGPLLWQQP